MRATASSSPALSAFVAGRGIPAGSHARSPAVSIRREEESREVPGRQRGAERRDVPLSRDVSRLQVAQERAAIHMRSAHRMRSVADPTFSNIASLAQITDVPAPRQISARLHRCHCHQAACRSRSCLFRRLMDRPLVRNVSTSDETTAHGLRGVLVEKDRTTGS